MKLVREARPHLNPLPQERTSSNYVYGNSMNDWAIQPHVLRKTRKGGNTPRVLKSRAFWCVLARIEHHVKYIPLYATAGFLFAAISALC